MQRLVESLAQVICYAIDSALMLIDDGGFAEWVSAYFGICADDILRKSLKEFVAGNFRATVNNRLDKELLVSRQSFLSGMFLENNQVRPGIGSCIIGESIVWQTQSRHKVGTLHKLHPDKRTGGIHHTLGCNESNQATLPHLVECFEKEVIVNGLCRLTVGNLLAHGISRIRNCEIPKGDIGGGNIEITVEITLYLLEALNACKDGRMQSRKDFAGQQILLIRQHLRTWVTVIA